MMDISVTTLVIKLTVLEAILIEWNGQLLGDYVRVCF